MKAATLHFSLSVPSFLALLLVLDNHHLVHGTTPIVKRKKSKNLRQGNSAERRALEKRASPFGQIEDVFVDTLKEDEEFSRRMQLIVAPFSIDLQVETDADPGTCLKIILLILGLQ